jgi:Fic family protein
MGMVFVLESREQWNQLSRITANVVDADLSPFEILAVTAPQEQGPSHTQAALHYLQQAKEELEEGTFDKQGFRKNALQLAENAISEIQKSMDAEELPETTKPTSTESAGAR